MPCQSLPIPGDGFEPRLHHSSLGLTASALFTLHLWNIRSNKSQGVISHKVVQNTPAALRLRAPSSCHAALGDTDPRGPTFLIFGHVLEGFLFFHVSDLIGGSLAGWQRFEDVGSREKITINLDRFLPAHTNTG